jgi:hypothetical protein
MLKAPASAGPEARARMARLALALVTLSQGVSRGWAALQE